jgi:membrane-associated protease RseP (regulator of RpoE activity)
VTYEQNLGSPSLDDPNDIQTVNRTVSLKTTRIVLVNGTGKELWSCNLGVLPAQEEYDLAEREYHIGNFAAAVLHYQKAASLGNPAAFSSLGYMYNAGEGLPEDKVKAFYWYRKSAESGNVRAQYQVAGMYLDGLGIEKDTVQASVWYRKAAEAGDPDALYALATLYRTGEVVSKDEAQVLFGFHLKAAQRGDNRGIAAVSKAYADGDGVAKDLVISKYWQHKLKGHGSIGASFLPQFQGSQYIGDMIGQVLPSSSAMKAGLKPKDVILSVNGTALTQDIGARDLIYNSLPGDAVKLEVLEYPIGTKAILTLNLEKDVTYTSGPPSRALLGVGPVPLPYSDAQVLGLPAGTGEIISSVRDNSPASQSGMRIGDIVLAVNGLPVTTERTLTSLITTFNANSTLKIEVLRNRNEFITLEVTLARWL